LSESFGGRGFGPDPGVFLSPRDSLMTPYFLRGTVLRQAEGGGRFAARNTGDGSTHAIALRDVQHLLSKSSHTVAQSSTKYHPHFLKYFTTRRE